MEEETKDDYIGIRINCQGYLANLGGGGAVKKCRMTLCLLAVGLGVNTAIAQNFMADLQRYFQKERPDSALMTAVDFVKSHPDSADAHGVLGMLLAEAGRFEDAISEIKRMLDIDSSILQGYRDLALIYVKLGKSQEALKILDDGIEGNFGAPDLLMARGILHGNLGRTDLAIADFELVLHRDPNHLMAYQHLALTYAALGAHQKGIQELDRGLNANPKSVMLLVNKGGIYHSMGKTEAAFKAYRQAIQVDPEDSQVYRAMGFMAAEIDSLRIAQQAWERSLELNPSDLEVQNALAKFYFIRGEFDAALQAYQNLLRLAPKLGQIRFALGQIYQRKGEFERAKKEYRACIELEPDWVVPYKSLGLLYVEEEAIDSALFAYKKALDLDPNDASIYNNVGFVYAYQGKLDLAKAAYQDAIENSLDSEILQEAQDNLEIVVSIQAGKLRVRHILVKTESKAQEILDKLIAGENFLDLVQQYSIDPSAEMGGNLGFFSPGDLNPVFEEAVLKLKPGEMSGIVETPLGFHIIVRMN